MFTASVTSENKYRKILKTTSSRHLTTSLFFFLSPLELVHGTVEAERGAQSHKGGLSHHSLQGDQEEAPPGEEDDLSVGQNPGHNRVSHKLGLQNRDNFALKLVFNV